MPADSGPGTRACTIRAGPDEPTTMNFALILFCRHASSPALRRARRPPRLREASAPAARDAPEPWWIEYPKSFFPVLLIVFALRSFVAEPFKIPSSSMRPTLEVGDFILVNKFAYGIRLPILEQKIIPIGDPKRGDVVVFRYPLNPSQDFIKRVIGVGGDTVVYKDKRSRSMACRGRKEDGVYGYPEGLRYESLDAAAETADTGAGPRNTRLRVDPTMPPVSPGAVRPFPGQGELRLQSGRQRLRLQGAGRPLFHDGRQPRPQRRQPLLGFRAGRSHPRQGVLHLVQLGRHHELRVEARRQRHPLTGHGRGR